MSSVPILLVVEDSRADFVLIQRHLSRNGMASDCRLVQSLPDLVAAIQNEKPSLVLSDYNIPGLPFQAILDAIQSHAPDVPIIVVSGTVGEEQAVELLKLGVSDFILKGNPARMVPVIQRTLRELDQQRAKQAAEAKLREQAELLDQATDAIVVRSLDDRILFWNKAAERLYGWRADEVLGRHVVDVLYSVSKVSFEEALAILMKEGDFSGRITHRHRNGSEIVVQSHWVLVRDDVGAPKSILAIHTDITERLVLEQQLIQFRRLDSLGKLTGGIAHDFNNLITVILGNAELLEEALVSSRELHELASLIRVAGERAADLTSRLLAFARRQTLEPQVVVARDVLAGMQALIQKAVGEQVTISMRTEGAPWSVNVDKAQFEAAILNLCINARDAMPNGGTLEIATANVNLGADQFGENPESRPGEHVCITIADTGSGMSNDVLAKAFEPFFTTKDVGKGSGLGLSMVYGFVMQSRGRITVDSEVGRGTAVRMYLPRSQEQAREDCGLPDRDCETGATEHIMLVEDDDLVRTYGTNALTQLGYKVTAAPNGEEALALLKSGMRVDLLFTDVVMPGGMSGPQLAVEAKRIWPRLPVLFTSGYATDLIMDEGFSDIGRHLLHKPYDKSSLNGRIRQLLGSRPAQDYAR